MKLFLITFLISITLFSCNNNESGKNKNDSVFVSQPLHFPSPNSTYKRDSLFIVATIWQFIQKEVSPFHYYATFNVPFDKITIDVDSIFYSPDSLKLFAFVIETDPDVQHNDLEKYVFSGNSIIGFRQNKKSIWTLYNFDQYSIAGLNNYNDVRNSFRRYYLGEGYFKSASAYYWDGVHPDTADMILGDYNRVSIDFGYNLDDKDFWDKSIVWKKGSRIPDYYGFQTVGNVVPGDENAIVLLPKLSYSDSLLDLYK